MAKYRGSTITSLSLKIDQLKGNQPEAFAITLRAALAKWKDDRLDYYLGQMRSRSSVVNSLPGWTAVLGVVGVLFSALTVVIRALSLAKFVDWEAGDVVAMSIAVVAYALMSAALVYERLTEGSGGYFRAASAVAAIRDLWSSYQFADIARALAPRLPNDNDEIKRWYDPALEFCKALDAIVDAETIEWKTAYVATAKLRNDTADAGLKNAIAELKLSADSAAAAAKEATKRADDAAKAAAEAAKTAAGAAAPATLDLTLETSGTLGEAIVKVDGVEAARGINQTSFSILKLKQGEHHIRIEFTPSVAGKPPVTVEKSLDLKGGINAEKIGLP